MTVVQAIILSVVEGITEFLPISSTAHLVLVSQILNIPQSDFVKSFEVIIQLGAILAVVGIYFEELRRSKEVWYKTILAFLPSAVIGFFMYDFIKERLIGNGLVTALALILGGAVFIFLDFHVKKRFTDLQKAPPKIDNPRLFIPKLENGTPTHTIAKLTPVKLLAIGVFQSVSMIPGVSRAAASIFGGLLTGLDRPEAVKFSFFLAIPTMLAATSLDIYKSQFNFSPDEIMLLIVGFLGSFLTALFAVNSFIKYVQKHSFVPFGIYRIVVGFIWLFVILKV